MPKLHCVLLVDDDPTTYFLNRRLLLRLGATDEVRVALNGQEVLAELHACQDQQRPCPMLIFLDVSMPVMGSIAFLEAYQQQPAVAIVILTTSVNPRDQQRTQQLPVAAYLTKPLTQQQVERGIAEHFA